MSKKKIMVIFGGKSNEYDISLMSVHSCLNQINQDKYEVIKVGLSKENKWYLYTGDNDAILNDQWLLDDEFLFEIGIDLIDKNFYYLINQEKYKLNIDGALIIMHGKYGEDGSIQGLLKVLDIKIIGCDTLSSALCMDKKRAHQLVSCEGVKVTKSKLLAAPIKEDKIKGIVDDLTFPMFVKPLNGGSSIGLSRVVNEYELRTAIDLAVKEDTQIVCEEEVVGFEVGCAILGLNNLIVSRVDEIFLDDCIFNYEQKYQQTKAKIILPARIDEELEMEIKKTALKIYQSLDCQGFARVDMFVTKDNQIYFNEVNTIPGLTVKSRYPKMFNALGISYEGMLDLIITDCLS